WTAGFASRIAGYLTDCIAQYYKLASICRAPALRGPRSVFRWLSASKFDVYPRPVPHIIDTLAMCGSASAFH
ncbi:hypothetical protein HAX54_013936, partial [Datura stramonium]|nr:hypothetical protein [Datura stramonium]